MDEPPTDPRAPHDEEALEALIGEALAALEAGGSRAVDALLEGHPERAEAVRRRLLHLDQLGLLESNSGADIPDRVGEFAIEDVLAEGGMGVVYRARDESLGRAVALKVVRPELLLVPGARARIRREAEAAAQLSHPNVAALHRYGEHEGLPYLAMELVEGRSLAQVLTGVGGPSAPEPDGAQLVPSGPASWTAACLQVCIEVAQALEHAHERGVLHRDVKPSNILVDERG
ncbi:MAG: serine/threonine-protein kinase, partial [Planctomycetota bacterium]